MIAGIIGMMVLVLGLRLNAGIVSPDGTRVAYTVPGYDDNAERYGEVFLRATDGSSTRTLGRAGDQRDQVAWIGNDRLVFSEFAMDNRCEVLDAAGKRLPDIIIPTDCQVIYLAVSPDGQKIAFTGSREVGGDRKSGLFVYDVKSREVKLLVEGNLKSRAAWSPDSRQLAIGIGGYQRDYPLQIVDATTGEVDDTGVFGVGASWSPDGKFIACTTDVQRGGSWFTGVPRDGKLGIYDVKSRKLRVLGGTEHAVHPVWSGSGRFLAYLADGKIGIADRDGTAKPALHPVKGRPLKGPIQMDWVGDKALYILAGNQLTRFEVADATSTILAEWKEPEVPALKPEDFKVVELPRVTVKYARIDRKYAEAFGNVLAEALKVYESLGFKMPEHITLESEIDPSSTRLWTDGESHLFLHLKSQELLAPASRTGVFNLYGMCHELGHIAMYRNLSSLMGLPEGVGEGWAHYAGCVVVTEVAAKLGKSIWPEYYDVADVEGIGRLKRASAKAEPWDKLDPTSRAALVFYRIETEYGRDKLAAAMTAALAEHPTGKDLMPLMLAKLRVITSNPTAADWVPESVLVPRVDWRTTERNPGDEFFADQKTESDSNGTWLFYDDGSMESKQSMSGAAETVLFRLPEGSWQVDGLKLFGARYGEAVPPKEDASIYFCNADFKLLREVKVPYSSFKKGDEKWYPVSFDPVAVPKVFYVGIDFHATATKGVYVGMDKSVERSHSRIAMPYSFVRDLGVTADWMLRVHLRPKQ